VRHGSKPSTLAAIMDASLIETLDKGIFLEKKNILLSWGTRFDKLNLFGDPETHEHSSQRTDKIWKFEKILGGVNVDLIVMNWKGIFGVNRTLKYAYSYLTPEDFQDAKDKLATKFDSEGKFKKINSLEFKIVWPLSACQICLRKGDRFGDFYLIELKHNSSWYGWLGG